MLDEPKAWWDAPEELVSEPRPLYTSLAEAKQDPNGVVILEGDYGGEIFLICPASLVKCTEEILEVLAADLNNWAWPTLEGGGAFVDYDSQPVGTWIGGGTPDARVTDALWLNSQCEEAGLRPAIQAIIDGRVELEDEQ
jgi:hypothetical protein